MCLLYCNVKRDIWTKNQNITCCQAMEISTSNPKFAISFLSATTLNHFPDSTNSTSDWTHQISAIPLQCMESEHLKVFNTMECWQRSIQIRKVLESVKASSIQGNIWAPIVCFEKLSHRLQGYGRTIISVLWKTKSRVCAGRCIEKKKTRVPGSAWSFARSRNIGMV